MFSIPKKYNNNHKPGFSHVVQIIFLDEDVQPNQEDLFALHLPWSNQLLHWISENGYVDVDATFYCKFIPDV